MTRLKVIYDTDPGVDDAMALLLLARHPAVDLLAVTTCFGNAPIGVTTRNALHLKDRFGFTAPVARGAAMALDALAPPLAAAHVHGDSGLGRIAVPQPQATLDPRPAAQLIVELVRAHPGEVTIIAVGRMTNLALALQLDPGIAPLVRLVSVMGGAFGRNGHTGNVTPVAEANIAGDALAADIVFGAAWPLTVVGLDVTHESVMSDAYVEGLRDTEHGQFLWDVTREYAELYTTTGLTPSGFPVHDSSAVAYAIAPGMFAVERGPVRVVTEGVARGQTILRPEGQFAHATGWDGRPSVNVCTGVDSAAFLALYRDTLMGAV